MITKGRCQKCSGIIEFDAEEIGNALICPHCQEATTLKTVGQGPVHPALANSLAPVPKKFTAKLVVGLCATTAVLGMIAWLAPKEIGGLFGLAAIVMIYFLPSIIGRRKHNSSAIFVLNLVAGWTFIGWVVALVWAVTKDKPS
jgi:Superinfection immunity protein